MNTAFSDLGLSEATLRAVEKIGYTEPTPVQAATIPLVLQGRDVCAAASTGTGKTAAFLLPTMSTLSRAKRGEGPKMLVVSPTRELASQIGDACFPIARETGHFIATVYGGTAYGPQIKKLKRGVDILIATPGRLNDLRDRGVIDLSNIEVLVLDEADRMLDMGFLPAMEIIINATPSTRQTLLFSATIDRKIMNSVGGMLHNPELVEIAHRGETAATVDQYVMPISQGKKPELLRAVLEEKGSERIIVFARTKFRTESCTEQLRDAGFRAESIHSDKSQAQRKRALENFTRGRTKILVATDVLARGIDVTGVDHVINFDLPDCPEDYVHRIGRTGRAGEEGYAISFVSPDTRRLLKDVEKLIGREIPFMDLENYDLDPAELKKSAKGGRSGGKRFGNGGGYGNGGKRGGFSGNKRSGGYSSQRSGGQGKRSYAAQGESSRSGSDRRSSDDRFDRSERPSRVGQGSRSGSKPYASADGRSKNNGSRDTTFHGKKSHGQASSKSYRGNRDDAQGTRSQHTGGKKNKNKANKPVPERYRMFAQK